MIDWSPRGESLPHRRNRSINRPPTPARLLRSVAAAALFAISVACCAPPSAHAQRRETPGALASGLSDAFGRISGGQTATPPNAAAQRQGIPEAPVPQQSAPPAYPSVIPPAMASAATQPMAPNVQGPPAVTPPTALPPPTVTAAPPTATPAT